MKSHVSESRWALLFPCSLVTCLCSGLSQPIPPLPAQRPSQAGCAMSGMDVSRLPHPVTSSTATSAVPRRCGDTGTSCPSCTVPLCPRSHPLPSAHPVVQSNRFCAKIRALSRFPGSLLVTALGHYSGVNYGCKHSEQGISSSGLTWQPSFTVQPLTLFH